MVSEPWRPRSPPAGLTWRRATCYDPAMRSDELRVVTWNVWFNKWQRELRQRALWRVLAALKPDVVCLQEVVPAHLDGPEIRDLRDRGWWISEQTTRDYGVILVTRRPVRASERIPLPSVMGRELLVVQLDTRPAITVATVHLESTPRMTGSRCRQLRDIHARLADEPEVLLVGDMNFPAGDRPEAACLPDWTDVWQALRPEDPGFTVDTDENMMRKLMKTGDRRERIDRALFRGDRWLIKRIDRLGTSPLPDDPDDPYLFVSDHFGLFIDLVSY